MSRALIPRESLEGARKLQSVRNLNGEVMPLALALTTWRTMGSQRQEQVAQLHQLMQPQPKCPSAPPYKFTGTE